MVQVCRVEIWEAFLRIESVLMIMRCIQRKSRFIHVWDSNADPDLLNYLNNSRLFVKQRMVGRDLRMLTKSFRYEYVGGKDGTE